MINLIAEGASPVTAMLLAGHEDVTTSSHYFSNLSQFISVANLTSRSQSKTNPPSSPARFSITLSPFGYNQTF